MSEGTRRDSTLPQVTSRGHVHVELYLLVQVALEPAPIEEQADAAEEAGERVRHDKSLGETKERATPFGESLHFGSRSRARFRPRRSTVILCRGRSRCAPLRPHESVVLEAVQSGVERALVDEQGVARHVLYASVTLHPCTLGPRPVFEHEQVECSRRRSFD